MAERRNPDGSFDNGFTEAVRIETARIYDCCSARDCFEDLPVYFPDAAQSVVDAAVSVRAKRASILNVFMDVEPVAFNKGFYSVDVTYFFRVILDAYTSPVSFPTEVSGLATFTKKVILYGSEGSVATFSTSSDAEAFDRAGNTLPTASIQVVEPIFLAAKLVDPGEAAGETCVSIPAAVASQFDGSFGELTPNKVVRATLGQFSIVNLQRRVQLLIPVYDYSIPERECCCNTEDPCEVFRGIRFPVEEFFPPQIEASRDEEKEEEEENES